MPMVLSFYPCFVSSDGIFYVVGAHDDNKNALPGPETYDVDEDKLEIAPPVS